jgi:N-methylhydantoinase A
MDDIDWDKLNGLVSAMVDDGKQLLGQEQIDEDKREFRIKFDCRYTKQHHEVSFVVPQADFDGQDKDAIADVFHFEHNRLYGYSLIEQNTPIEMINVRVQALGFTEKPSFNEEQFAGSDSSAALKGERPAYIFSKKLYETVPVYDGHKMHYGNRVSGPAIIEEITTAIYVSESFDCLVDQFGSFALYKKGHADLVSHTLGENAA